MTFKQCVLPCVVLALLLPAGGCLRPAGPQPEMIVVEATYPGANAQTVAEVVAAPIEEQVNGVEGLLRLASRSSNDGTYTLHVTFKPGMDLNIAQVLVQNRVSLALPTMPTVVQQTGITVKKLVPGVLLFVVLFSPDDSRDMLYLSNYAQIQLKDELARLPGVGDVTLFGGQDSGLHIRLDPDRLAAHDLTAGDVLKALREQNGLKGEQFADVIVKASETRPVRLKDVAAVELGASRSQGFARLDGKPVVALGLSALPKTSPRDLSAAVASLMKKLKERLPAGIDHTLVFDLTPRPDGNDRPTAPGCLLVEPGLPAGDSGERALKLLDRGAASMRQTEGVNHTLTLSENPFCRFRNGPCILALLAPDTKPDGQEKILQTLRTRLEPIGEAEWRLRDLTGLGGFPVDLAIRGPETAAARQLAEKLVERLARTKKLTDVAASRAGASERQLHVDVNRDAASAAGVSAGDIADTLQVYLGSAQVGDFPRFGRTWKVQVQVGDRARDLAEDVKRLKIRSARGQMVPLSNLVKVREVTGPLCLDRLDLQPMVEITANPARGVSLAEARWLCETLAEEVRKELRLPAENRLVWLRQLPAPKPIPGVRKAEEPDTTPPEVSVSKPVEREVTDSEDFTGRTEAVQKVEVKARVSGYLLQTPFKEGAEVKKGDLLFEIDPRPYQAQLDQALSQVGLAEAILKLARTTLTRDQKLNEATPGSITQQQLDQDKAAVDEAEARVKVVKAGTEVARLNLQFCKVTAPIDGQVGRYLMTIGNLAQADQTTLTTIVSRDPMYVYFEMDERTLLRLRRAVQDGKIKSPQEGKMPVLVGLADEQGFPHEGTLNFVDNQVDPVTSTIRLRAVLPNPGPVRMLSPGLFVRVRLPLGPPRKALLVPEGAVGTDQGLKFLYVIDDQNKVVYRRVTVGALQDGLRVINAGVKAGERVITGGLKKVRPGIPVKPREESGS